tara:strand:+ start:39 stop:176 length:138 start_codon:yes stop_codon:yes gene_type:complete
MLWAAGTPIAQDVLIRDLADAPAATDLDAETPSEGSDAGGGRILR